MWQDSVRSAADILSGGSGVLRFCKREGQEYRECRKRHQLGELSRERLENSASDFDRWKGARSSSSFGVTVMNTNAGACNYSNASTSTASSSCFSDTDGYATEQLSSSTGSRPTSSSNKSSASSANSTEAACFEEIENVARCSWNYASGFLLDLASRHKEVQQVCTGVIDGLNRCHSAGGEHAAERECTEETLEVIQCSAAWFNVNHDRIPSY